MSIRGLGAKGQPLFKLDLPIPKHARLGSPMRRKAGKAMAGFHELQDLYYDAIRLREELDRIPPRCDCADAPAHLSGQCCCAKRPSSHQSEGCLSHLEQLTQKIGWFREDMHSRLRELRPGELPSAAQGRLSLMISLVDNLDWSARQIQTDLAEFGQAVRKLPSIE